MSSTAFSSANAVTSKDNGVVEDSNDRDKKEKKFSLLEKVH